MSLPEGVTELYNEFFELTQLTVLPKPALGKVVTVTADMSVRDATRLLAQHNILSAPVAKPDAKEDESWLDKYVGTIDAVNLMYWMLDQVDGVPPESVEDLLRQEFTTSPISEVMDADPNTSRFSPFVPLDEERSTMLDVMLLLGKYALHRAYIVHTCGDITNVITQSAVVKFLHEHKERMASTMNRTLKQLGLGQKAPVTVTTDDTFWTAFKLMREKCVSALPVVDDTGVNVGVVSSRDARLMIVRPTRLRFVNQPLSLFNDLHVAPFDVETVCCTLESTLGDVVDRLISTQVHRVFVVDDKKHPVGVVALRDVIACLCKEPKGSAIADYFVERSPA
ncbi:hypothetical protein PTSG_03873 [Salpingoeca rosetta]|uniref:CBS domain-containing protein n=1 Tax=Salpingoeca rosetta (strain ATCC 50818 / BSB-021) TaxID=946362 RepID=F2U5M5_SALR5|nr:uncharacterized protein PTSG_03873 [Salpingoeca rosetta]EGD83241.1 hypothetical protein PTSG_03873 [Salpingoeca rosetta]|eukprot:XP_004995605.1 hypothetical protein PTSG_03873 [Salpingoeca rosetta]